MTRRLFLILGGFTLVVVVAAGSLLGAALTREAGRDLQIDRSRSLSYFAALAEEADRSGDTSTLQQAIDRHRELFGESIVVALGGDRISTDPMPGTALDPESLIRLASRNQAPLDLAPLSMFAAEPQLLARSFGTATQVTGSVVMAVDPSAAVARLRWQLLALVGGGVVLVSGLLAAIAALTRWILRPVRELDRALETLALSEHAQQLVEAGPPELRALTRRYQRMADALTASLDRQRALTGETSHQVRNALGAAMIRVDLLEIAPAAEHVERVRDLGAELRRLERTLDGMMRLAHAEHRLAQQHADRAIGAPSDTEASADLAATLRAAVRERAAAADADPIRLALPSGPVLAAIPGFEAEQLIGELLSNADKYGAAPVTAGAGLTATGARVWVRDRGAGLSPDELRSVRQRFWRSYRHRSIVGHGLGLSMADRLTTAHGGSLELSSPRGGGLLAVASFPLPAQERAA